MEVDIAEEIGKKGKFARSQLVTNLMFQGSDKKLSPGRQVCTQSAGNQSTAGNWQCVGSSPTVRTAARPWGVARFECNHEGGI